MADALTTYFGMTNPEVGASSDSWGTKENADRVTVDQMLAAGSAWVAAGGTVNAITATYSPALLVLADGVMCAFRASGANTSTTPTFAPNGLTAHIITKTGGSALAAGDIIGTNAECILRYNLANTRWELLNPSFTSQDTDVVTTATDFYGFVRSQKTTGIAQSTTADIFRLLDASGTLVGNSFAAGHLYINVVDEGSAANNSTFVWVFITTGDGNTTSETAQVDAKVRGVTLVAGFQIASDGAGGAGKFQIVTAASSKTVTVRATFVGQVR